MKATFGFDRKLGHRSNFLRKVVAILFLRF